MNPGGERPFLSIGEVLGVLQPEFPDVTISKIRFLESQGLIDPERTPSGYRKFYDDDLVRLRFILREQKDHFLPLKVIKDRLEAGEAVSAGPVPAPVVAPAAGDSGPAAAGEPERLPVWMQTRTPAGEPPVAGTDAPVRLTLEELAASSGLAVEQVREIESFGLVHAHGAGRDTHYDSAALAVARLAAVFLRHGIEARHLRMYRNAADREAGIIEQAVMPLVKQRNPRARAQATAKLDELVALGAELRETMVRTALAGVMEAR